MQEVALVDYGSGNLRSAEKALQWACRAARGARRVATTADPERIARADRIVLPGVGAFRACMLALQERAGVLEALEVASRRRGAPFLGICVGMQLMASRGREFDETRGFDWISGEVRRLAPEDRRCKTPHMGWNALEPAGEPPLLRGLPSHVDMYFTHSYAFFPDEPGDVAAWTEHGGRFPAAVLRDNLAGVQFHPEKSQRAGLALLTNFLEWRP
ncbi:MAG TPA: imidazole glycerol phosphate synthase subunit HisH [Caulobacteraceae bacterium]|nr:imidazole glycerol phosphate synthase subunit HisH [Caulobacteraceae bacterium]